LAWPRGAVRGLCIFEGCSWGRFDEVQKAPTYSIDSREA
jgi:hypothetical protein